MVFPWLAAATLGNGILGYAAATKGQKSGKQRGIDQKAYFDEISPNSTEFERLGVPGLPVRQ